MTPILCKNRYRLIFKIFPNLSQNFRKIGWVSLKFGPKLGNCYMNGWLFLEKLVFVWVYFQISLWHVPTKTKLKYPTGRIIEIPAYLLLCKVDSIMAASTGYWAQIWKWWMYAWPMLAQTAAEHLAVERLLAVYSHLPEADC